MDLQHEGRKVMVVSINGKFRGGKSFLMNTFLRHLDQNGTEQSWIKDFRSNIPLKGFEWGGGSTSITGGIVMWSNPFIISSPANEEVAILLMDSQGFFCRDTNTYSPSVFAFCGIFSSIQIVNLFKEINEFDLEALKEFSGFGKTIYSKANDEPFQNLIILIRDCIDCEWQSDGKDGGKSTLEGYVKPGSCLHPGTLLRQNIDATYKRISCYLMPSPGEQFLEQSDSPALNDISEEFLTHAKRLAEDIFHPNNLIVKKVGGSDLTGLQLFEFIKKFTVFFNGINNHDFQSLYQVMIDSTNLTAMAIAKDWYDESIRKLLQSAQDPLKKYEIVAKNHDELLKYAVIVFERSSAGDKKECKKYKDKLVTDIKKINKSKLEMIKEKIVNSGVPKLYCALSLFIGITFMLSFLGPLWLTISFGGLLAFSIVLLIALQAYISKERCLTFGGWAFHFGWLLLTIFGLCKCCCSRKCLKGTQDVLEYVTWRDLEDQRKASPELGDSDELESILKLP